MTDSPAEPAGSAELAELTALGPFFHVRRTTGPGAWHPLRDLLEAPVLDARVSHVHRVLTRLADTKVETRVAASTMSLGLFARLLSPALGAAALDIALRHPTLDDAWWQPAEHGPWPLAITGPSAIPDLDDLVRETIDPLVEILSDRYSLSKQILRGNAASAAFGAASMVTTARPDLADAANHLSNDLLSGPLAGTGDRRHGRFVRASCCLYYRLPGGGYCGDCILTHPTPFGRAEASSRP